MAIPAQLGLTIIGGEGALVLGGFAAAALALPFVGSGASVLLVVPLMVLAAMAVGGLWIGLAGLLRLKRGVNETISSLLLSYIAIAVTLFFVEGPLRDPASTAKASTLPIGAAYAVGKMPVLTAMLGGAIRVSTPFIFVALGETLTEKSGRINLGLEGTLVLGAMLGYATAYATGSPWLGVLAGGLAGLALGALHGLLCSLPRVNDIAVGIALMTLGTGLAFFFGKSFIQPQAPHLPSIPLADWTGNEALAVALRVNPLFFVGIAAALVMAWGFRNTRVGLVVRTVGDSAPAALAMGLSVDRVRVLATMAGGFLAGVGGSFLSLYYPGSWNEGLSSGQGLMAVALVIFARWSPVRCVGAALLFGAAGALGPALQSVGVTQGYYLFNAAPYVLTLLIMVGSSGSVEAARAAPGELSITR